MVELFKEEGRMASKKKSTLKLKTAPKAKIVIARKPVGTLHAALVQINKAIGRFEGEVETLVKKLVKQGERSRKDLRKNFDILIGKIRADKLIAFTRDGREELEKEVKRLAEDVIGTIKEVEVLITHEKFAGLFTNARESLSNLVEVFAENGLLLQAKRTVLKTRKEILGILSIPTQSEVEKLERKIVILEKRLSNLARRAA
jgi:polyhydroxyalkanoate synthesis regulator phasin